MSLLIRAAKIIDQGSPYHLQTMDILVQDGIVTQISAHIQDDTANELRLPGLCVSMGWTDIFADYRDPGYEQKETMSSGLAAAAAGGYTSVFLCPSTQPVVSSKSVVQYLLVQAKGHLVTVYPMGTISAQLEGKAIAEMLDMHHHGAVAFTDAWKPIQNAGLMLKSLEYAKSFGGILLQIPLEANLAAGGLMHEGIVSTQLGMPGIPALAETLALYRDIELLRYTESKLHVTGISCAESVQMIRAAKAEGLEITCSVTPYHLALNDEALRSYQSVYKVMPPIRSEADRLALIAGLKDGVIDCIASHHRPQEWDAKAKEFEYAGEGMNVQELAYSITQSAVAGQVDTATVVDRLANKPNQIFGLGKGGVRESVSADFTLFSDQGTTQKSTLKSLSANNPFLNVSLPGCVYGIVKGANVLLND